MKDDTGLAPETTKRIAQELIVQDKVQILIGPLSGSEGIAVKDYNDVRAGDQIECYERVITTRTL